MSNHMRYVFTIAVLLTGFTAVSAFAESDADQKPTAGTCLKLSQTYNQEKDGHQIPPSAMARQLGRLGRYYCYQRKDFVAGVYHYQRALNLLAPARYAKVQKRETVHIYGFRAKFKPVKTYSCGDCVRAMHRFADLSGTEHTASKAAVGTHYRNGIHYCTTLHNFTKGVVSIEKAIALIKAHPAMQTAPQQFAQSDIAENSD